MGRLYGSSGAGRSAGRSDPGLVQMDQQSLRVGAWHADVQNVRHPLGALPDYEEVGDSRPQPIAKLIAETGKMTGVFGLIPGCELRGATEGHCAGDILGAGTDSGLLRSALDQGMNHVPAAHHERADALRAPDLMGREAKEIAGDLAQAERQIAECLNSVGVKQTPAARQRRPISAIG